MAVNSLNFEQSSAFLLALYNQATGANDIASVNAGNFVTVAQKTLSTGYDTVINAISQVLGRTIFSVRPYESKLSDIMVNEQIYGAITRKINFIDGGVEDDSRMNLTDGQAVDQWVVKKPKALQTNFYGFTQYQKSITIFKDQLDAAFSNANDFGSFIGGVLRNVQDELNVIAEQEARACMINFATGKFAGDSKNAINVAQLYFDQTGAEVSVADLYGTDKTENFVKWLYSTINTIIQNMTERTEKYHINVTGNTIQRHTPEQYLKAYMLNSVNNSINANVLSSIFNPERLKTIDFKYVNFWQSIDTPGNVIAKPTYLQADGTLKTEASDVTITNLLGMLFDEEALGITRASCWTQATPMNARGGYYNIFYHFTHRMWNDFTENGVILYLGTVDRGE